MNTFVIFASRLIAQLASGFLNRDGESSSSGNTMVYFAVSMVLELVFGILASIITMWFSAIASLRLMQAPLIWLAVRK